MENCSDIFLKPPTMDITEKFVNACKCSLQPGELCSSSWFTLQHAMSSIEVMDPKMDIRSSRVHRVESTTEVLTNSTLQLGSFDDLHVLIGVMDKLLCSVVNWLTGDSLAQTVFTCRYMHCTQLITDPYLATFCELCRRSIRFLRQAIISINVFDEEDHYAPVHNVPLNKPDAIYDRFLTAESDTILYAMSVQQLLYHSQKLLNTLPDYTNSNVIDSKQSLKIRLEFAVNFLILTSHFDRNAGSIDFSDSDERETDCPDNDASHIHRDSLSTISPESFWANLSGLCTKFSATVHVLNRLCDKLLLTSVPTDHAPGFELYLNYIKLPSHIPRTVVHHDSRSSFSYLHKLTSNILHLLGLISGLACLQSSNLGKSSLHFILAIYRAIGQTPCSYMADLLKRSSRDANSELNLIQMNSCLLTRTICFFLYLNACQSLPQMITSSGFVLQSWLLVEPEDVAELLKERLQNNVEVRDFLRQYNQQLIQILRIYCHNRSRQRSALAISLQEFCNLMTEGSRIQCIVSTGLTTNGLIPPTISSNMNTAQCPRFHLNTLLSYYYYQLSWDYLMSGFELQLYNSREWVYLYAFLLRILDHLRLFLYEMTNRCAQSDPTDTHSPVSKTTEIDSVKSRKKKQSNKLNKHRQSNENKKRVEENCSVPNPVEEQRLPGVATFCGPISRIELLVISIHRFIASATLYTLRALQLDSGGDPVLDLCRQPIGYSDPFDLFARRLSPLFLPPDSPFTHTGGLAGAFTSCKLYLTSKIFITSTGDLYNLAATSFEQARLDLKSVRQRCEQELPGHLFKYRQDENNHSEFPELLGKLFGSSDSLQNLERLSGHNAIACRLLSNCPERRPCPDQSVGKSRVNKFPPTYPVSVTFDQSCSLSYPLIRLVSTKP